MSTINKSFSYLAYPLRYTHTHTVTLTLRSVELNWAKSRASLRVVVCEYYVFDLYVYMYVWVLTYHTIYSACQTFTILPSTCVFYYATHVCLWKFIDTHSYTDADIQINFHLRVCLHSLNLSINITANLCTFICTSWKSSPTLACPNMYAVDLHILPARISMLRFFSHLAYVTLIPRANHNEWLN